MNWARDNAYLSKQEADLKRIFKYETRTSLAVKIVKSNGYQMQLWRLQTDDEWTHWLEQGNIANDTDSGIVLILAKRSGERPDEESTSSCLDYSTWYEQRRAENCMTIGPRRQLTFATLSEGYRSPQSSHEAEHETRQPGIRTLPFSYGVFKSICESFRVHESITKAITRSDVPSFSCEKVMMNQPAYVYNCRTSNSFPSDMALSATSYPDIGRTYAILYGCTSAMEESILQRLNNAQENASYPLLMPGIFAELELLRHTRLVEASIVQVETKIFELDFEAGATEGPGKEETELRSEAKRTTWLDLTYLRNSLITWSVQIQKMSEHTRKLDPALYQAPLASTLGDYMFFTRDKKTLIINRSDAVGDDYHCSSLSKRCLPYTEHNELVSVFSQSPVSIGEKVRLRLDTIQHEYEEKIRDCTMRLDGMAMATQWSHSETAVEMALATNRESRVMKSISLVTMIFLPGTFFATVFSMTFFDWSGKDGKSLVSSYLWIYIVVTTFFTAATVGTWYFFVIHRRTRRKIADQEKRCVD